MKGFVHVLLAGFLGASLLVTGCATTAPPPTEAARFKAVVEQTFHTWSAENVSGPWVCERLVKVDDYQVAGEFGWARGTYMVVTRPRVGGDPLIDVGPFLTVFRKQADGSWKLYRTGRPGLPE